MIFTTVTTVSLFSLEKVLCINNACAVGVFQLMFILHAVRVLNLAGLGCTYPYVYITTYI